MRLPPPSARAHVVLAAAAWLGAAAGRAGWPAVVVAAGAAAVTALPRRTRAAACVLAVTAVASLAGGWSAAREEATLTAELPVGRHRIAGRVVEDPRPVRWSDRFLLAPSHLAVSEGWVRWQGPRLAVFADGTAVAAGDRVVVTGEVRAVPGRVRGDPVAGSVFDADIVSIAAPTDPLFLAGNLVRRRVEGGLARYEGDPAAALLSGFLIGDVRRLPAADEDALRRAGLSHFVAVSGSNVALFLGAWWLAVGRLGSGPRKRAVVGLAALAVFVVVTRWEPSVLRAAVMAAFVLVAAALGRPLDPWSALAGAVAALVLAAPELTGDVGFQLSAAATAGVLAGAGLARGARPRWLWVPLAATLSAQAAVAGILLWHFGSVPLLSPVSNLAAAPLVTAATALGGIGVLTGLAPLVGTGVLAARGVLAVARVAGEWPQIGPAATALLAGAGGAWTRRGLRPVLAVAAPAVLAFWLLAPAGAPRPAVVFLDVGQGDAALLLGEAGESILVDGGPDGERLLGALRRHGVRRLDLVIVSHRHADHVTGVAAAVERLPVGRVWRPVIREEGMLADLVAALDARGIPHEVPETGGGAVVGGVALEVLGPLRRYASPNDESLVVRATVAGTTVLLAGDIEAVAQRELGPLAADVLKVPHQGAATSDPAWLAASAGRVAVISVGPNDFGHPSPGTIAVLEEAGAVVHRTDRDGDVVLPLPLQVPAAAAPAADMVPAMAKGRR